MDSSIEDRLVALESRLAFHEAMADDLSDILTRQQDTIDLLTRQLRLLQGRIKDMEQGWERSPQDDKPPPHY